MSYAYNDGPVTTIDRTAGEELPEEVISDLTDPVWEKVAWNAGFEIQALEHCLDIKSPVEQWYDPTAEGRFLNLPVNDFGLGSVCKALNMPEDLSKEKDGKQLVKLFACIQKRTKKEIKAGAEPTYRANRETHAEEWQRFKGYNAQDVIAMREATKRMEAISRFPAYEHELWCFDHRSNRVGIPLDQDFLNNAKRLMDEEDARVGEQIRELTGVANPNSLPQLKRWLELQGYPMKSMDEEHVNDALAMDDCEVPEDVRKLLLLRQRQSGSGPKKIPTMLECVTEDGRLRGQITYYGTLNGRFKGRQSQPHNLPRCAKALESRVDELTEIIRSGQPLPPDLDVVDVITSLLRSAFRAPDDMALPMADFSQVEPRILGWMTECPALNHIYEKDLDLYKSFASGFYGVPYDKVTKRQRNDSKAPSLGCGYGLRALGLVASAKKQYGVIITEEIAQKQIDSYSRQFPEVCLFWDKLESAAKTAITRKTNVRLKCLILDGTHPYGLKILLPSGRWLFYPQARVVHEDGRERSTIEYKYGKGWTRVYGSLLTAHVNSAIARDLLVFALMECQREGLTVAWHVHDEVILLSPADRADADRAKLQQIMNRVPSFLEGLAVRATAEIRQFWKKD